MIIEGIILKIIVEVKIRTNMSFKNLSFMKKTFLVVSLPIIVMIFGFTNADFFSNIRKNFGTNASATYEKVEADTNLVLKPNAELEKKAVLIVSILKREHYKKQNLNDSLSMFILDKFINELDKDKLYFQAADIKKFQKYRTKVDDELAQENANLTIPFNIYNTFTKRVLERIERNQKLLKEKYEFTADEYYETDRDSLAWFSSEKEMDKEWRKIIKNEILTAKLTGEKDTAIVNKLGKRYGKFKKNLAQTKSEEVFQRYMNCVTESYDPHTSYFSPIDASNFKMTMNSSLEGIGANLGTENDYTVIKGVRPGSPAFKSKKLAENDKIVGVAQGDDGKMVDVVGWQIDETIQLIRGKKGTVVRLSILSAKDGTTAKPQEVRMIREKINIDEAGLTKKIVEYEENNKKYRVGVLTIPSFYFNSEDFRAGNPDYKSTTNDTKKALLEFEKEKIDALVIDLRFNGGGSLKEAIDLTSLFVNRGVVVQVKDANGRISAYKTDNFDKMYDGQLVVLTSRFSASASEIFAGAIQDYKRGIVLGERTYGKGTVQNMMGLGEILGDKDAQIGDLKLTLQKYYRANGTTTQLLGVQPDVEVPSMFSGNEFRESMEKSALPADVIRSASPVPNNTVSTEMVTRLRKSLEDRKTSDPDFKKLVSDVQKMRIRRSNTKVSLNEVKRKKELDEQKAEKELNKALSLEGEEETPIADGTAPKKKLIESYKSLKDLYIKNSVKVAIEMTKP